MGHPEIPFDVRMALTIDNLRAVCEVRTAAYGHHDPEIGQDFVRHVRAVPPGTVAAAFGAAPSIWAGRLRRLLYRLRGMGRRSLGELSGAGRLRPGSGS